MDDSPILLPKKTSVLPWILFAVALLAGAGGVFIEKQRADTEAWRANSARDGAEKARVAMQAAEEAKRVAETRVSELQAENGRLAVKVAAASKIQPVHGKARKHKRHKRG